MRRALLAAALVLAVGVPVHPSGATSGPGAPSAAASPTTSRGPVGCEVPQDRPLPGSGTVRRAGTPAYPTVSDAVRAAEAGDTVLVPPGTWSETVVVEDDVDADGRTVHRRDGLRIQGLDRDRVVFDGTLAGGQDHRESAFVIRSDRVVLENLTVRHYSGNPLHWEGVEGFWGRYLTVYGGGVQNLASASRCGQLDHLFVSGMATVGIAVAGCFPCDTTITSSVVEDGWVGIASLNARGGLHIGRPGRGPAQPPDNTARDNHMGVLVVNEDVTGPAPGLADEEALAAAQGDSDAGTWVSGNLVEDNDNGAAVAPCGAEPACGRPGQAFGVLGVGIYVVGVRGARVEHNRVHDHDRYGIGVFGFPGGWPAVGNTVVGNAVTGTASGFDLVQDVSAGPGNCWAGNEAGAAAPERLQDVWACGRPTPPGGQPAAATCLAGRTVCQPSTEPGGARPWAPRSWKTWNADGTDMTDPRSRVELPAHDGRPRGTVEAWIPEVRPYCGGTPCSSTPSRGGAARR